MFKSIGNFLKSKFTKGKISSFLKWIWKDPDSAKDKVSAEVAETIKEIKKL